MRGLILAAMATVCLTTIETPPPSFHVVALGVESPRLLGMSMDEDDFIWLGSTHRKLYRYDPRRGTIDEHKLPFDASTCQTLCVGKKVYLLGQTYPKLMIFHRDTQTFSERPMPNPSPDVWYGTRTPNGNRLYLFDRNGSGIIRWDTSTDTGKTIAYPYRSPLPASGQYVAGDRAIWCGSWDFKEGKYLPIGLARLDLESETFTGWFPFPDDKADLPAFTHVETTLFYPLTLKGKIIPFDYKARRWGRSLDVPGYGKQFGFIGGGVPHQGRWYFSLSTYNGGDLGCDGKPHHFRNGLLEFDPKTRRFRFPTLERENKYYQISYVLSERGYLYATGNNVREPDGSLNNAKVGDAVFWQTQPPREKPSK